MWMGLAIFGVVARVASMRDLNEGKELGLWFSWREEQIAAEIGRTEALNQERTRLV